MRFPPTNTSAMSFSASKRTISASFPSAIDPFLSYTLISLAGFSERSGKISSRRFPVNARRFFKATFCVKVLPALTPFSSFASPSSTITSFTPSLYHPSGRPAAIIESVIATTLSSPFTFKRRRTVPG